MDIDLYKPIRACLPRLYNALEPNGLIVVDDCDPKNPHYDGAYYAYIEFVESQNLPIEIFGTKLGLIRKASHV